MSNSDTTPNKTPIKLQELFSFGLLICFIVTAALSVRLWIDVQTLRDDQAHLMHELQQRPKIYTVNLEDLSRNLLDEGFGQTQIIAHLKTMLDILNEDGYLVLDHTQTLNVPDKYKLGPISPESLMLAAQAKGLPPQPHKRVKVALNEASKTLKAIQHD